MKNARLDNFLTGLRAVSELRGIKFAYAVAKNTRRVLPLVEDLKKAVELDPAYIKYEEARMALCTKHARKDEDGQPVLIPNLANPNQHIFVMKNQIAFDEDFNALRAEHQDAIDAHEEKKDELAVLLEEESELEIYTIPFAEVPEDITAGQLEGILDMIEEEK